MICRHRICRTKLKAPRIQSARGLLRARLSYQFLSKSLPSLARGPYSAETKRKGFAKNRSAATLGALKLGSAATSHPTVVSSASKTPISIGSKWAPRQDRAWRSDSWPKIDRLPTALRTGGCRAKPWPKPIRKIAPTGASVAPRRSFSATIHPSTSWAGIDFPMRQT